MKQKTTNKDMNYRSIGIEQNQLRAVQNDDGTTTVSGTAIVFNQPSQPIPFIEYISRDALNDVDFSKTLLLYAHDYNKILARADSGTLTTKIDDSGLHFTAKLPDTTLANDVREDINAGNLKGCSFGFTIADGGDRYDTDSKGQTVHYVDKIASVSELTITPIPAYNQTSVQVQRDLNSYLKSQKEDKNMEERKTQEQQNEEALDEKIKKAVREAVQCLSKKKRDDEDADDVADDGIDVDEEDDASSSVAASSAVSSATSSSVKSSAVSSASSTASSSVQSSASSQSSQSRENQKQKEEKRDMINITPENSKQNDKQQLRDFAHFLVTREMRPSLQREAAAQGIGLTQGSVLIPESILAPLHEEHQFNRLENFTHNVNVTTTTGKQPYFQENTGVLQTKAEFDHAKDISLSNLKFINWDLKTYAGKLAKTGYLKHKLK